MKVLQVVDGFGWGGTKEQVYLTTRELAKKGIDIGIALSFQYTQMVEKLKPYPVRIHFFEDHRGSKSRFNPLNWFRLKRIIEENNYDIVIGNSPHAVDYIRFTLPFLRKRPKLIFVRRSGRVPSLFSKRFKYSVADRIVVVSRQVLNLLKENNFLPDRLVYIPSGVDLNRFRNFRQRKGELRKRLGLPLEKKIFINVANWNPSVKGQPLLLRAFKRLACKDCILLLVGLGTDSKEVKSLIKSLGLEGKVLPFGFREDIPDLLNAADYFVLSSYLEGIAGALLQAMATGMVALSTAAGGIGEYLKNGENGFLVPVGDEEKLTAAMGNVLKLSPQRYKEIAHKAIETAKEFSVEKTTERYIELFKTLLG